MQKSSKSIKSGKNIQNQPKRKKSIPGAMPESLQIIRQNCKSDHIKDILMSNPTAKIQFYNKEQKCLTKKNSRHQKLKTENNKQNQLGNSINRNFSMYKLNESIRNSQPKLPSIHNGSSYKKSFAVQKGQNIIKGKQQQTFFLKQNRVLPALSEYRKSFETSPERQKILGKSKGFPNQQHISVPKYSHFRGVSNYNNEFHGRISSLVNANDCIKNKDHLTKKIMYPSAYFSSASHSQHQRKQSYKEPTSDDTYRHSSNQHYFPMRASTIHQYQSTYNNVYHRAFEEDLIQK